MNDIKSLGFNVIRIPFSNQMVESDPVPTNFTQNANGVTVNQPLVGQTALQDLDTIVSYAGSIGLRVILDNHRSEAGESNEASGLWYTSAYPQANWIADWQNLATRYSAGSLSMGTRRLSAWTCVTSRILSVAAPPAAPAGQATPRSTDVRRL